MVERNIPLAYILAFAKNTWFWLGIWVFYYLQFTSYAGIGLIETTLVVTFTITEIPTGAVADLLGKRKTLIIAFLLEFLGSLIMVGAQNLEMLMFSVFVMCVGGSFYSGTIDALIFDTLKQKKKEETYDKVIANISTISLIAPAVCGFIGGFLYLVDPRLPFLANSIGYFIGMIATLFLVEPVVDTIKFSFRNFVRQTHQGLRELFKTTIHAKQTLLLVSVGCVVVIASEMLDGFLGFEFGFTPTQLGMVWSIIFLVSAFVSQLTPLIRKKFSDRNAIFIIGSSIAISLILSPKLGFILGGLILAVRASLEGLFGNFASIAINKQTRSEYRATTISTYNMIKNVPYVLFAYFIGRLSDSVSAKTTALVLGVLLLALMGVQILVSKRTAHSPTES